MRIQINYVVLPSEQLRELCAQHLDDPDYFRGQLWQSSEHHLVREHSRSQIEEAAMTALLGSVEVGHMKGLGIDVRPLLRGCVALGAGGCFDIHEVEPPRSAIELLQLAEEVRLTAATNLASLNTSEA